MYWKEWCMLQKKTMGLVDIGKLYFYNTLRFGEKFLIVLSTTCSWQTLHKESIYVRLQIQLFNRDFLLIKNEEMVLKMSLFLFIELSNHYDITEKALANLSSTILQSRVFEESNIIHINVVSKCNTLYRLIFRSFSHNTCHFASVEVSRFLMKIRR